jgi:hypothetical protein
VHGIAYTRPRQQQRHIECKRIRSREESKKVEKFNDMMLKTSDQTKQYLVHNFNTLNEQLDYNI